jgi:hypothetical protein
VGRELRAMTLGGAAASVPQPAGAVGAAHPGGQGTGVDVVEGPSVGCRDAPGAALRMVRRGMRLDLQGAMLCRVVGAQAIGQS